MNIPKEVIDQADRAWRDNVHASPEHVPANPAIFSEARQAEYRVVAEWALREVAVRVDGGIGNVEQWPAYSEQNAADIASFRDGMIQALAIVTRMQEEMS